MSETPDVKAAQSDTYKEIYVTGKVTNLSYDGLRLTVLRDSHDLTNTLSAEQFKASKVVINRQIECTLHLSPQAIKDWAITLAAELKKYEGTFGAILSPQEVQQKIREYDNARKPR